MLLLKLSPTCLINISAIESIEIRDYGHNLGTFLTIKTSQNYQGHKIDHKSLGFDAAQKLLDYILTQVPKNLITIVYLSQKKELE